MGGNRVTSRVARRVGAVLAVGAAAIAMIVGPVAPVSATTSFAFSRQFSGINRYDTARLVATNTFSGGSAKVLLATGNNFPDALAANYLAGWLGVPLLLTDTNQVPAETNSALETLGTTSITLLGGPSAISATVETSLRNRGFFVDRISGLDRYDTALALAKTPPASNVNTISGEKTAILASGTGFADALAAGPLAYAGKLPLLLTTPDALSSQARQGLTELGIQRVLILGGTAAVSQAVEDAVRALPANVSRLAGPDRTATATAIASYSLGAGLGFSTTHVNLARGDNAGLGLDALAGGPHGGVDKSPILLAASPTALDTSAGANASWLQTRSSTLTSGHIFGGTAAISKAVEDSAAFNAGAVPPEAPSGVTTPTVSVVNLSSNYFISSAGRTYYYGNGLDTYQLKSNASDLAEFERVLNPGDIVTVNYSTTHTTASSFNVTSDSIAPTSTPTVRVAGSAVTVSVTLPSGRSAGTIYTLQRATYPLPECSGPLGAFSTDVEVDTEYDGFFDDNPANGCYVYRVKSSVTSSPNASVAFSANSANADVPSGSSDTTAPKIDSVSLTTDSGLAGRLDTGDVHTFVFSERMAASTAANGSTYRLSDGDGTTADIVCGSNATCTLADKTDNAFPSPRTWSELTVTLTSTPVPVSVGTTLGLQYPATILSMSAQFTDLAGNQVTMAGSDVTIS